MFAKCLPDAMRLQAALIRLPDTADFHMHASLIFKTVPIQDSLSFGSGGSFNPKLVADFMDLDKATVSRLASVAKSSVRYDDHIPRAVLERLEEIGAVVNMVAEIFGGDREKTALWFRTKNPMLGDISPRDMVRLGRYDRLRRFIISAMQDNGPPSAS